MNPVKLIATGSWNKQYKSMGQVTQKNGKWI